MSPITTHVLDTSRPTRRGHAGRARARRQVERVADRRPRRDRRGRPAADADPDRRRSSRVSIGWCSTRAATSRAAECARSIPRSSSRSKWPRTGRRVRALSRAIAAQPVRLHDVSRLLTTDSSAPLMPPSRRVRPDAQSLEPALVAAHSRGPSEDQPRWLLAPIPARPAIGNPSTRVYGGAHLFKADSAARLGAGRCSRARRVRAGRRDVRSGARPVAGRARAGRDHSRRVVDKLTREPVEDFRIDFEDGYGNRPDAEEDGHARSAARGSRRRACRRARCRRSSASASSRCRTSCTRAACARSTCS